MSDMFTDTPTATAADHEAPRPERAGRKKAAASTPAGLRIERRYTRPGEDAYGLLNWELRSASINDDKGKVLFEQKNVEFPASWSQTATNIVVSKYFYGPMESPIRERSLKTMVDRVVGAISGWGRTGGYFASEDDAVAFEDELKYLCASQMMAFNSPVWFNVGIEEKPQASACFIQSVGDTMEEIMDVAKAEAMLFKFGSGTGTNRSTIRSSREKLSSGGTASGPVSFMRGYDAFAGVIKSGGKTRRAAKMEILNDSHPDIREFILAKQNEEKKAWALIEQGYDPSFNGEAYGSVFFQNSNFSVRATDEFMRAVLNDGPWTTHAVTDGRPMETLRAKELMDLIAQGTYVCGDPGMQFDSTIQRWHTCKNSDKIHASNPCSEYIFLDDTACNLASLNLMKFRNEDGTFDVEAYRHAVRLTILAQEILVDNASYPTEQIARNSHRYRTLGLGYANLGAILMSKGLAYDSDAGRAYAAALTAILCGEAYAMSAEIARVTGPFEGFEPNREPMLDVIRLHRDHVAKIDKRYVSFDLMAAAQKAWDDALSVGQEAGFKNAQVTVLAPTGTIGFMMDCDTTGVEPAIALVSYKKLVGGGLLKLVNGIVPMALRELGYAPEAVTDIVAYIDQHDTIEGAPGLKPEHLSVFDCAFKPYNGTRSIGYRGHIKMMAAAQPFLSGAISKTVNMPEAATPEEIAQTYIEAWQLGVKCVAIYRDNSKRTQPLNTSLKKDDEKPTLQEAIKVEYRPVRRRLPDERQAITHKFSIAGHEGYVTVGMFEDGKPGEIFITMSKEGSVISGLMDSLATMISLAFQYGVPLEVLVKKFAHMRFEPSGFTNNRQIPIAKSIMDYLFRWLELKFMPPAPETDGHEATGSTLTTDEAQVVMQTATLPAPAMNAPATVGAGRTAQDRKEDRVYEAQADAPPCTNCGEIMVRGGSCYKCLNCGSTSGCS